MREEYGAYSGMSMDLPRFLLEAYLAHGHISAMNRELVVLRDAEGKPLLRPALECTAAAVLVASDDALKRIEAGDQTIFPIAFRRESVFAYDGKPLPEIVDWKKMKRWKSWPAS